MKYTSQSPPFYQRQRKHWRSTIDFSVGSRKQLVAGTREFSLSVATSAESRVGLHMRAGRFVETSPSFDLDPTSYMVHSQIIISGQIVLLSQKKLLTK